MMKKPSKWEVFRTKIRALWFLATSDEFFVVASGRKRSCVTGNYHLFSPVASHVVQTGAELMVERDIVVNDFNECANSAVSEAKDILNGRKP